MKRRVVKLRMNSAYRVSIVNLLSVVQYASMEVLNVLTSELLHYILVRLSARDLLACGLVYAVACVCTGPMLTELLPNLPNTFSLLSRNLIIFS